MTYWKTEFAGRRHLANFHLGLGDIRITVADQDDIVAMQDRLADAEGVLRCIEIAPNMAEIAVAGYIKRHGTADRAGAAHKEKK
jgi:hypothetical protein